MVNLPPVGRLIPTRDEPRDRGVVCKLQELDGLVTGGATVGVQYNRNLALQAGIVRFPRFVL